MIDWTDPDCRVSKYFTVQEAIGLPGWKRLADASDGFGTEQQDALVDLFKRMDKVREFLGVPIIVHCAYRPPVYNDLVGGARDSAHMARNIGKKKTVLIAACDWHPSYDGIVPEVACEQVKEVLPPLLEQWGLRMEAETTDWIHLDTKPVPNGGRRVFSP